MFRHVLRSSSVSRRSVSFCLSPKIIRFCRLRSLCVYETTRRKWPGLLRLPTHAGAGFLHLAPPCSNKPTSGLLTNQICTHVFTLIPIAQQQPTHKLEVSGVGEGGGYLILRPFRCLGEVGSSHSAERRCERSRFGLLGRDLRANTRIPAKTRVPAKAAVRQGARRARVHGALRARPRSFVQRMHRVGHVALGRGVCCACTVRRFHRARRNWNVLLRRMRVRRVSWGTRWPALRRWEVSPAAAAVATHAGRAHCRGGARDGIIVVDAPVICTLSCPRTVELLALRKRRVAPTCVPVVCECVRARDTESYTPTTTGRYDLDFIVRMLYHLVRSWEVHRPIVRWGAVGERLSCLRGERFVSFTAAQSQCYKLPGIDMLGKRNAEQAGREQFEHKVWGGGA
eukprot:4408538-Pleurochrysis_carterae.AAC.3